MYYGELDRETGFTAQSVKVVRLCVNDGIIHAIDKATLSNIVILEKTAVLIKTAPQLP